MKRDMELIRKIVSAIEDRNQKPLQNLQIEGSPQEEIDYHCYLLIDGGYAEGSITTNMRSKQPSALLKNLTWQGHEFADLARSQKVWQKTMAVIKNRSDTVGMSVLMKLLSATAEKMFGL